MFKYLLKSKQKHCNSNIFMKPSINLLPLREPPSVLKTCDFWLPLYLDTNLNRHNKHKTRSLDKVRGASAWEPWQCLPNTCQLQNMQCKYPCFVPQQPHVHRPPVVLQEITGRSSRYKEKTPPLPPFHEYRSKHFKAFRSLRSSNGTQVLFDRVPLLSQSILHIDPKECKMQLWTDKPLKQSTAVSLLAVTSLYVF